MSKTPNAFIGIVYFRRGIGRTTTEEVPSAEQIRLEHVSSFNRKDNMITMSNGHWFQLKEEHMLRFLREIDKNYEQT